MCWMSRAICILAQGAPWDVADNKESALNNPMDVLGMSCVEAAHEMAGAREVGVVHELAH